MVQYYVLDEVLFSNQNFNVTKMIHDYRGLKESELDENFFNNYDLTVIGGGGMIDGGKVILKVELHFQFLLKILFRRKEICNSRYRS